MIYSLNKINIAFGSEHISELFINNFLFKYILRIEKHNKNILLITFFISSLNNSLVSYKLYKKHNPEDIISKQNFYLN